jgi:hypothetical protein
MGMGGCFCWDNKEGISEEMMMKWRPEEQENLKSGEQAEEDRRKSLSEGGPGVETS